MHIAVIIPARNSPADPLLMWTLEGYAAQKLRPEHTLHVRVGIDGIGGDATMEMDSGSAVRMSMFTLPRIGAAGVRNFLVDEAPCDLLIFGNADARPDPDMVQQHADAIAGTPEGSLVLGSAPWEKPASPTVFDALLAETPMVFFYQQLRAGDRYDFRHCWTLNLSVRTKDFISAGGFHEKLRPVYYEDLAFAHRLLGVSRKGILYHPAARVTHRHPTTLEQYLDREELLGLMSPVLAKVSAECFAALHPGKSVDELTADYRAWITMDHAMHRHIFDRLKEWAGLPESMLPSSPDDRARMLSTLYQMHIPLKRLAFRLGFLRGLELVADARWQERKPQSLWRKVVSFQ